MTDQETETTADPASADGLMMTPREHARHSAMYIAAEIAKSVAPQPGDLGSQTSAVLAAADRVYEWLVQPPAAEASA